MYLYLLQMQIIKYLKFLQEKFKVPLKCMGMWVIEKTVLIHLDTINVIGWE